MDVSSSRYFSMHTSLLLATVAFLERGSKGEPIYTAQLLDALEERGVKLRSPGGKSPGNSLWVRFEALAEQGMLTRKTFPGPGRGAKNYAWRTTAKGRKHLVEWNALLRTFKVHLDK